MKICVVYLGGGIQIQSTGIQAVPKSKGSCLQVAEPMSMMGDWHGMGDTNLDQMPSGKIDFRLRPEHDAPLTVIVRSQAPFSLHACRHGNGPPIRGSHRRRKYSLSKQTGRTSQPLSRYSDFNDSRTLNSPKSKIFQCMVDVF